MELSDPIWSLTGAGVKEVLNLIGLIFCVMYFLSSFLSSYEEKNIQITYTEKLMPWVGNGTVEEIQIAEHED